MNTSKNETRPEVDPNLPWMEFERWYWPVNLLRQFCEELEIPSGGTKKQMRLRVAYKHGAPEITTEEPGQRTTFKSTFNWSRETLTPQTVITDNVSFDSNFRAFFRREIGDVFV